MMIGNKYFKESKIVPIGTIERFHRILPKQFSIRFRQLAFKMEKIIPKKLNLLLARSQMIQYKYPK